VLRIDHSDLPKLDRPWTRRDVRPLRDSMPDRLTDARRRQATRVQEASQARAAELDAAPARPGYDAPDLGTLDQTVRSIDFALTHLMTETRCCEGEADRAAWRRWPKSMTGDTQQAALRATLELCSHGDRVGRCVSVASAHPSVMPQRLR
jgi:hypothetical protein